MLIPNIYLTIAGQVAIILVFLIAYLIYMLVSEENRWENYTDKLKSKIRELLEFKGRFDVVSENLHKQMEITKELTLKVDEFDSKLEAKDDRIAEQETFISELQNSISESQDIIKSLEETEKQLNQSDITISELKTQIVLLEDQGIEINDANITITPHVKNNVNINNDDFNLTIEGVKKSTNKESDIKNSNQDEMARLKKNYKNQKNIIDDLESALMNARNNPTDPVNFDTDAISKLNQMLTESTTVVEMLEGEIDLLQNEINQLMEQNKVLTDAIDNTASNTSKDEAIQKTNSSEAELFGDTSLDASEELFGDTSLDEPNETIKPDSEAVFFDDSLLEPTQSIDKQQKLSDMDPEMEQLQMQLDSANQMTMTMMMAGGDQGNIISFARNSIQFQSLEDLAKGVLETVVSFQVNGALQLRGEEHDAFNISSYGKLSAQDNEKISIADIKERFTEDGSELLIKFENLSLLIKDMPLSDNDKLGRIKDNMAITLELASANLSNIEASLKIRKNQRILNQVLKSTYETIQNVEQQFNEQNDITNQVINSLTGIISNPAMTEGMDPIYKDVFTSIINDGKTKFDKIKETGVAIDGNFTEVIRRLGSKVDP